MNALHHYSLCPVCGSNTIGFALNCTDHTVSHQTFEIWQCKDCTLRFTQNGPVERMIGPYYQSESYISHSDTNKGLISKMYKLARKYTLAGKRKLVQKEVGKGQGRLLDIGCGTGAFLQEMQQAGWQVTGLEPDTGARQKAAELYELQTLPSEKLYELDPQNFEVSTMWHVLEHVYDLQGYMAQIRSLLAPGGVLLIAVPNYLSADARHYKEHWAAYDVPRHLYHFTPEAIRQLAIKHGFEVKKQVPMWLDAFYIAMLSEQYKYGKNRLLQAFTQGLKSIRNARNKPGEASSIIYVLR